MSGYLLPFEIVSVHLLVVLVGVLYLVGNNRLNRGPDIAVQTVEVPSDPEALREGARLATISSCSGGHGPDLGGDVFIDSAPIGYMPAPNLTSGAGGWAQSRRRCRYAALRAMR
jgi:hypothetical protein